MVSSLITGSVSRAYQQQSLLLSQQQAALQQGAFQQASLNQQSSCIAQLQQQSAASQWAAQQLAAQGLKANPFANAIRTAVARLPLEWADFCEHVKDWSTDRLLSDVKRLRAERSAAE